MPEQLTKTAYQYAELDDSAKAKARDWYREGGYDYEWWDYVYEDVTRLLSLAGFRDLKIYFSGFSSQGDGACFECRYSYAKGAVAKIKAETGNSEDKLTAIVQRLQDLQRKHFYRLTGSSKHSGHYYHEFCTSIDCEDGNRAYGDCSAETEKEFSDILRDLMRYVYRRLESEFDYLNSDESVAETIEANEYDFEKDGRRARF